MKKQNNRGLTLVELLIALAVSSIILSAVLVLVTQGLHSFQKQTLAAKLQEDADIAMNQISDSVMEATEINISNYSSDPSEMKKTWFFESDPNTRFYYDDDKKTIMVQDTAGTGGSILCQNVTDFRVQIIRSSVVVTTKVPDNPWIESINNPVQIKVTIKVSDGGITRNVSRVTGMRNSISNLLLQGCDISWLPNSNVLNDCEFLTD